MKKATTSLKVSKIDNYRYRLSIDAVIVKQKHHKQWIILINDDCIGYGATPEEAIKQFGYTGNIRYTTLTNETMKAKKINSKWKVWYETSYVIDGEKFVYVTKSYTDYHKRLHENAQSATTMKYDKTVDWPFGLYAEIVQTTKKQ